MRPRACASWGNEGPLCLFFWNVANGIADGGLSPWSDPDGVSDGQTAASDEAGELTYVDIDTFEATF